MLKYLLDGLKMFMAGVLVLTTLMSPGCAWIQSGERLDETATVRDGQDNEEMYPVDPSQADISAPEVNRLP